MAEHSNKPNKSLKQNAEQNAKLDRKLTWLVLGNATGMTNSDAGYTQEGAVSRFIQIFQSEPSNVYDVGIYWYLGPVTEEMK